MRASFLCLGEALDEGRGGVGDLGPAAVDGQGVAAPCLGARVGEHGHESFTIPTTARIDWAAALLGTSSVGSAVMSLQVDPQLRQLLQGAVRLPSSAQMPVLVALP